MISVNLFIILLIHSLLLQNIIVLNNGWFLLCVNQTAINLDKDDKNTKGRDFAIMLQNSFESCYKILQY